MWFKLICHWNLCFSVFAQFVFYAKNVTFLKLSTLFWQLLRNPSTKKWVKVTLKDLLRGRQIVDPNAELGRQKINSKFSFNADHSQVIQNIHRARNPKCTKIITHRVRKQTAKMDDMTKDNRRQYIYTEQTILWPLKTVTKKNVCLSWHLLTGGLY